MVWNKQKIVKKMCLVLGLAVCGTVGVYTLVGNYVSAAGWYSTMQISKATKDSNINDLKEWLSDRLFKFIDFVKSWLSQTVAQTKDSFDVANNNVKEDALIQDYFPDIAINLNRYYINYLAKEKIISNNQWKFNPENFVRLNELAKMIVNSYRYKVWYNLDWNVWLSDKNYFNKLMPKYYNTAYEIWLLNWLENLEEFERFVSYEDVNQILQNFKRQYPDLLNLYYLDLNKSDITISRWDISRVVFKTLMLDLDKQNNVSYQDTYYHTNFDAIQTLADLDILNKDNTKFYPDNNISRGDFVVMLVKSYLKTKNKELSISNMDFDIEDLDYNSNYAPYLLYAKQEWLIDYLFEVVRSKNYININKKLSKHEAYYIISNISDISIDYDILKADKESVSRWEIAQVIVDAFKFSSNSWETKSLSAPNSQIEKFVLDIKSFANSPKIARLLN